jgi:Outer membrane protein beta-barrel domain
MKKSLLSGFFALLTLAAFAQNNAKSSKGRPNIPGTFLVEIGINRALDASDTFNIGLWGSRSLNLYYQYDIKIPILKGKFSFHPGIGFSMERYKFKDGLGLAYDADDELQMQRLGIAVIKSQLIANYLDAPLELRFSANPDDPSRTFKTSIGFRPGVRISSFTKVKFEEDGEKRQFKNKQGWNLNDFRYGVYLKMGVGNISLFGYYNLTTNFKEGEGIQGKDINTLTVGLSLGGF